MTVTFSAALLMGAAVYRLVPVRGTADIARRGVRHIRVLPRIIQPSAGYREHHDKPVPAALAEQCRKSERNAGISERTRRRVPRICECAGHEKGRHDQTRI